MVGSLIPLGVRPNVRLICEEVVDGARRAGLPVRNVWGYGEGPDHNNRRCLDFMITSREGGEWIARYLWTHRRRLGLHLYIWDRRLRRNYRKHWMPVGYRQAYRGPSPHTDHVHAEFREGPYVPSDHPAIGPFVVDPAKVDTWLWEVKRSGRKGAKRRPGYVIRDGVRLVHVDGREWVETRSGSRYARAYLRKP